MGAINDELSDLINKVREAWEAGNLDEAIRLSAELFRRATEIINEERDKGSKQK